ncbi:hypothetical protein HCU40_03120 [Pseudanabaena biceps]|nr:hypothetical protein [Pseudanabaena biceps]
MFVLLNPSALWVRLSVSELKRDIKLREVAIESLPVDDDDLEALLGGVLIDKQAIAEINNLLIDNMLLDDFDNPENINIDADAWMQDSNKDVSHDSKEKEALIAERDRLQKDLQELRSQHEFECEYVDQLEQEIISVANDRDRQVTELKLQLEQLQIQSQHQQLQPIQPVDDKDLSDRLAIHVLQIEEEFQHRLTLALEIETQKITQSFLQEINKKTELIHQLQCQNTVLDISQQTLTAELETTQSLLKESTKTLELAQTKLTEVKAQRDRFEEELIQHLSNQAQLHQSLRGLENEYVSDLTRVQELEQQIEELQNQVLHQASRASEYEAAIQHWKEQSVRHQHHSLQLSGALDRLLDEKPIRHLTQTKSVVQADELIAEKIYQSSRSTESSLEKVPVRSPHPNAKVDLPFFLVKSR